MSTFEVKFIEHARGFCAAASNGIKRFGNDSLYQHSVRVFESVQTLWPDDLKAQVAAFLHDLVEDTFIVLEDIERHYGAEIASTVDLLTARVDEDYDDYLIRLIDSKDLSALRVKYCDGIDNSDICVGLIDAENLSVKSFLYYRAKYRIATGLVSTVIRELSPINDPISQVHAAISGVWESNYDRTAIKRLRDNVHVSLHPKGRLLRTIGLYDENPHWNGEYYISPWGGEVERRYLEDDVYTTGSSNYHFTNMYAKVRAHLA